MKASITVETVGELIGVLRQFSDKAKVSVSSEGGTHFLEIENLTNNLDAVRLRQRSTKKKEV
jgi:hypothetical protein